WAESPLALFRRRILGKIVLPYLLLIGLIALVFFYVTTNLVATSLEDRFRNELADAGRSANEAMVKVEGRHLTVLRSMAFTVGVDEALAMGDADALRERLGPIVVSQQIPYVDVFSLEGGELLALRLPELGPDA